MTTHSFGDYHFSPHKVFPSVEAAAGVGQWDFVVVCTKALPDVTDDSATIAPLVPPDRPPTIVLIQNGVGVEHPHRRRFPTAPLVSAVTVVSAEQTSPGHVRQNRWTRISCGPFFSADDSRPFASELEARGTEANRSFVELLKRGGIKDAEEYDEKGLQLVRWHKIAIKCVPSSPPTPCLLPPLISVCLDSASMNPSAVLSGGVGNAAMSVDPDLRAHLHACMTEVLSTAPKLLSRPFPKHLATADQILRSSERNAGGKPSMLVDWEAGRTMELEVILGNPVRLAKEKGLEMPRLQSMYALLKMAQRRRQDAVKRKEAKL